MQKYSKWISILLIGCCILSACSETPADTPSAGESDSSTVSTQASAQNVSGNTLISTETTVGGEDTKGSGSNTMITTAITSKTTGNASNNNTGNGSGTVSDVKLPDLKGNVMDNQYQKKTYSWSFDGTGSTFDYLDSLGKLNASSSVSLASDASLQKSLGLTQWVQATKADAYIQYQVTDLAGLMMEWYSKSAVSVTIKVSADGKSFSDLKTKQISADDRKDGYKQYVLVLSEMPDAGMKYVRIPVAQNAYLGRVILDDCKEVYNKAGYAVTFEQTTNLKAKNGVYEVTNANTAQITLYREQVRSARFVLRYKGSAPRFKLEVSDEGNTWTTVSYFTSEKKSANGYSYCTVSVDGQLPARTVLLRLSLQRGGKNDSLALSEVRLDVPELYDYIKGTNGMYSYTTSIVARGREDMQGATLLAAGEGNIVYNVNDIKGFSINTWYSKAGEITVYGSADASNWSKIDYATVDSYVRDNKTYQRLRNSGNIPSNINYLRVTLKSPADGNVTNVSSVHLEGVQNKVAEMQRICTQQGVSFKDVFSTTFAAGRYSLRADVDMLNEGIESIVAMGGKMVNLWFDLHTYSQDYKYNSDWGNREIMKEVSYVGLAKSAYFKKAFSNPGIERYSLMVNGPESFPQSHNSTIISKDRQYFLSIEYDNLFELCDYLMKEYNGTGKTFIIQTWESDGWVSNDLGMLECYKEYIDNRQKAVNDARKKNPKSDVKLYNCMEIAWVETVEQNSLLHLIIPQTNCDLYAYSCWDSCVVGGRADIANSLNKFASNVHASETLGSKNFYIGEYGIPEMEYGTETFFSYNVNNCKAMLNAGYRYVNYWNFYCNEGGDGSASPGNDKMRGFWLIRADGTKTCLYNYFKMLLTH